MNTMKYQISFIFLLVAVTYVSSSPLESCTVSRFEDVEAAAKVCSTLILGDIVVPKMKTLTIPMKDGAKLVFNGHITHVPTKWAGGILVEVTGRNLDISGTSKHLLDGVGHQHWQGVSEKKNERPRFIWFRVQNSNIHNLHLKNCPNACIMISGDHLNVHDILIDIKEGYPGVAPGQNYAINTDGFDVAGSNIRIWNATVYNQDDCVAITGGYNLYFENLYCNGSHGLSFSVVQGNVYNVEFKNCLIEHASNAIHIKTHNDHNGVGKLSNVTYDHIEFNYITREAISIQQNYPLVNQPPNPHIKISDIKLRNIGGTLSGKSGAIAIICAKGACENWHFDNIRVSGAVKKNTCENVPVGVAC